jgi:hypothetical protein
MSSSPASFAFFAGIPSIDLKFISSEFNLTEFPPEFDTYRTLFYETPFLPKFFI